MLALQILDKYYEAVPEYDYEFVNTDKPINSQSNALTGLIEGKAICRDDAENLRNLFRCVQIDCQSVEGYSIDESGKRNGRHEWLQIKVGEHWMNLDATYARPYMNVEELSGDLFVHDAPFYRKKNYA